MRPGGGPIPAGPEIFEFFLRIFAPNLPTVAEEGTVQSGSVTMGVETSPKPAAPAALPQASAPASGTPAFKFGQSPAAPAASSAAPAGAAFQFGKPAASSSAAPAGAAFQFGKPAASSSAAPDLLGTGAPFGAAASDSWTGGFGRAPGPAQAGGSAAYGGWQGWHQQAWCDDMHRSEADWQAHSQDHWPGAASSSRAYRAFPGGGPDRRTRL